jgi:UDP-N-acetylglucosamine 2-epimerase (non-hydrolysing)
MYFDRVKEAEKKVLEQVKFSEYALVTFHRAENVDDTHVLKDFMRILKKSPIPIVFPIHPRTKKRLREYGMWNEVESIQHLQLLPPQGYFEFLALMKNCKVIMTDSGAIVHGFARVVGINPIIVLAELEKFLNEGIRLPEYSPFGDGKAAIRIVDIVMSKLEM